MYNDEWTEPPANEAAMWETFEDILDAIASDLSLPLETRVDALEDRYHRLPDGSVRRDALGTIRYRKVSEQSDGREHFLEMARNLLPRIAKELSARRLTPHFVHGWGQLLFCHGYVASHVLDDGDHVEQQRRRHAGSKTVRDEAGVLNAYIATLVLWFMDERGERRKKAEHSASLVIKALLRDDVTLGAEDREWFKAMLSDDGVSGAARQKSTSVVKLREMAVFKIEDMVELHPHLPRG